MKKACLILISLFVSNMLAAQANQSAAESIHINHSRNALKVISDSENRVILELETASFTKLPVRINGDTWYSINLNDESLIKEKGLPELAKVSRSILIPGSSDFSAKILSADYHDIILAVKPSKGILSRSIDPDDVAYTFSPIYSDDAFYPEDRYRFSEPHLIRESRGIVVDIFPFAYNPVKHILRIYTKLKIEISFSGTNLKNAIHASGQKQNRYFEPILRNHFINYNPQYSPNGTRTVEESGKMLIICYDGFIDEMEPFVNFKINRGMPTEIVSMNVVGTTSNDVKTYIQNAYNTDNSLTFVLLVGDHAQIPSIIHSGGGSDPSFSLVSGDDNYPDIIVGRFSAQDEVQVETMVSRSIAYENMEEQNWFHAGMGIASDDGSGDGDDSEFDWQHLRNIRTDLLNYHYTSVSELYEGSRGGQDAPGNPTSTMISNFVNTGVSIINYTGHGSSSSWVTGSFSSTHVNALTNDDMLPFIFSVACTNGNFTNSTCFAETWLRATNSITDQPTGAVGFYGSSINQSWSPPMEAQDAFNELLVNEDNITFGALCYNGSCSMMDEYGSGDGQSGTDMFLTWHIFGDPSIHVIPDPLGVCREDLNLSENVDRDCIFHSSNTIAASNVISNCSEVHIGANTSITLLPGFHVEDGCAFLADLNGCSPPMLEPAMVRQDKEAAQDCKYLKFQNIEIAKRPDLFTEPVVYIYPNPAADGKFQLEILSDELPQSILIFNAMGVLIYNAYSPAMSTSIDISNEKGLIFIKVNFSHTSLVKKLISR